MLQRANTPRRCRNSVLFYKTTGTCGGFYGIRERNKMVLNKTEQAQVSRREQETRWHVRRYWFEAHTESTNIHSSRAGNVSSNITFGLDPRDQKDDTCLSYDLYIERSCPTSNKFWIENVGNKQITLIVSENSKNILSDSLFNLLNLTKSNNQESTG